MAYFYSFWLKFWKEVKFLWRFYYICQIFYAYIATSLITNINFRSIQITKCNFFFWSKSIIIVRSLWNKFMFLNILNVFSVTEISCKYSKYEWSGSIYCDLLTEHIFSWRIRCLASARLMEAALQAAGVSTTRSYCFHVSLER